MENEPLIHIVDDYIVDQNNSVRCRILPIAIKRALVGRTLNFPNAPALRLEPEHIAVLPQQQADIISLAAQLTSSNAAGNAVATDGNASKFKIILINAELKLKPEDDRIKHQGIDLAERLHADSPRQIVPILLTPDAPHQMQQRMAAIGIPDKFFGTVQLPFRVDGPHGLIATLQETFKRVSEIAPQEYEKLSARLKNQIFERQAAEVRHRFRGAEAAVRVFLGAIGEGAVERKAAETVVADLKVIEAAWRKEKEDSPLDDSVFEKMQELIDSNLNKGTFKPISRAKKVLFVDDEGEKTGWKSVLKALLAPAELLFATNEAEAMSRLTSHHVDFVLLDYNFDEKPEGLHILNSIKSSQFDIPVIMLTAYDDAETTKQCLIAGADDYFVKKLRNPDDRGSVSYYEAFCNLLAEVPLYEDETRVLWRKFVAVEPKLEAIERELKQRYAAQNKSHEIENVVSLLRKAIYLLSTAPEDVRVRHLLVRRNTNTTAPISKKLDAAGFAQSIHTLYAESISDAFSAVENLLENEARRVNCSQAFLKAFDEAPFSEKIEKLNELRMPGKTKPEDQNGMIVENAHKVWDSSKVRRLMRATEYIHGLKQTNKALSQQCFAEAIEFICDYFEALTQTKDSGMSKVIRTAPLMGNLGNIVPNPQKQANILDEPLHVPAEIDRTQLAAIQLLVGGNPTKVPELEDLLKRNTIPLDERSAIAKQIKEAQERISSAGSQPSDYQVLLLDDDASQTGWENALTVVLNQQDCEIITAHNTTPDFVLLDLCSSQGGANFDPKFGFAELQRIKTENISLPVCVMTSIDESIWARKCLRGGADDYFPLIEAKPAQFHGAFVKAIQKLSQQNRQSRERICWDKIAHFEGIGNGFVKDMESVLIQCPSGYLNQLADFAGVSPKSKDVKAQVAYSLHESMCHALRRAYFFLTLHLVPYDQLRTQRLLLEQHSGNIESLAYEQVALNCSRLAEFTLDALVPLGDKEAKVKGKKGNGIVGAFQGSAFYLNIGNNQGFKNPKSVRSRALELWYKRNEVIHHGIVLDKHSAADLIEMAVEFAEGFVRELPVWCNGEFSKGTPQS